MERADESAEEATAGVRHVAETLNYPVLGSHE